MILHKKHKQQIQSQPPNPNPNPSPKPILHLKKIWKMDDAQNDMNHRANVNMKKRIMEHHFDRERHYHRPQMLTSNDIVTSSQVPQIGKRLDGRIIYMPRKPRNPEYHGYPCMSCDHLWDGVEDWYYINLAKKDWLCKSCGEEFCKDRACLICGLCFSDSGDENANWIQCDTCDRWVMTACDGIKDISLYDDSTPNHLMYSCPTCSNRMTLCPLIFHSIDFPVDARKAETTDDEEDVDVGTFSDKKPVKDENDPFYLKKKELLSDFNDTIEESSDLETTLKEKCQKYKHDISSLSKHLSEMNNSLKRHRKIETDRRASLFTSINNYINAKAEDRIISYFTTYFDQRESLLQLQKKNQ
eukprot:TRINITY_DN12963_c0_g1_i1.p1 TRINITY_DN12963_c0_g1~~TRINITY_DN12963_c0_g1_i1.p1  ORF type:complete len:357 (-),score=67.96 TRINITY_DN12963_c0_g1_i1:7-1077(-)